jgi:rhodanese-related sulfurtransferase
MNQLAEFLVNHWGLSLALLLVLGLLIGGEIRRKLRGIPNIAPLEATRLVNHEQAIVLDTRDEGEYRQGHILNAVHIPLADLERRSTELERFKGRPVIAYCRSGNRSLSAGALLKKQGFERVFNLGGGILAWQNANLPVTTK